MNDFIFNIIININNFIYVNYYYSFFIYFFIAIIFFTLSLPGGLIISLASGFFFGFLTGFFINIISASIGSLIFIIFSKTIFKKIFNKYYLKYSEKLSKYIQKSSFEYLILIRLMFGSPLVFQNICISMLNISKIKIFTSSLIGFAPLMLLFSYSGSYVSNVLTLKEITLIDIFSWEVIIILLIIICFTILRIALKK
tara:strand:+ start:4217 stop:4807 length:591 start_codon:yes stop_codon:yes gene_type:complete